MKIVFLQLPVQSRDYEYSRDNIPLAAGYLKAFAAKENMADDIVLCPPEVASLAGDAALVAWIEKESPRIVAFSAYVWNVERIVYLCRRIRERMPGTAILLGGPEVQEDNPWLLGAKCFDFGIAGEGEESFVSLLRRLRAEGITGGRSEIWRGGGAGRGIGDINSIPSPYLAGYLSSSLGGAVNLETARGCPHRCIYCYYHKSFKGIRFFNLERIGAELAWSVEQGAAEVNFLDPSFIARPDLHSLLRLMADARRLGGVTFSCELNAEDLTDDLCEKLASSGLREVEIGLQTTNPKVLRAIGRRFHADAFASGVKSLRGHGVKVTTDIMVGLPGDGLADCMRSIDFVVGGDLCDNLNVYPLCVLPGTVLREKAREFGIVYQESPPYLAIRTPSMTEEDMRRCFAHAEDATGNTYFPVEPPLIGTGGSRGYVYHVVLGPGPWPPLESDAIGQGIAIEPADPGWHDRSGELLSFLRPLLAANPFSLVSWLVPEASFHRERSPRLIHAVRGRLCKESGRRSRWQCFLRLAINGMEAIVRFPLSGAAESSPLWCGLPEKAGPSTEDLLRSRLEGIFGFQPEMDIFNLPAPGSPFQDRFLRRVEIVSGKIQ